MSFATAPRQKIERIGRQVLGRVRSVQKQAATLPDRVSLAHLSPPAKALQWVQRHELPTGGVRVHSEHRCGYPEVTGYLVPTLLDYGERELARRLVHWLMCTQRADGGFPCHNGTPYVFDTGQILRGLLAASDLVAGALDCAERAGDYLCRQMPGEGREGFGNRYGGVMPETVHLYVLPPLIAAAEKLHRPDFRSAAENCCRYYMHHPDFLKMTSLTHFQAYELEALIELNHAESARPTLDALQKLQAADGGLRGYQGVTWTCSTGLAQLAVCWYRMGDWEPADRGMLWLEQHQEPGGGFRGSYGAGAAYFPKEEISWAVKYYLDAHRWRVRNFFNRSANQFPEVIDAADGRVQAVLQTIRPGDRVLEAGCGKGRLLRAVADAAPDCRLTGVDISEAFLACLPSGVTPLLGSMESIPCPDDAFDVVFSVEALEHSPNPDAAIREMIRVARPGGWVIVIDKQRAHWGRMSCPPWERWPAVETLKSLLGRGCDEVAARPVAFDRRTAADGMMVMWRGRKRTALNRSAWGAEVSSRLKPEAVAERVRTNQVGEWSRAVVLNTAPGERVLELGAGTGETSLILARGGRQVVTLDFSRENLQFIGVCAGLLALETRAVCADVRAALPFADGTFDCVWSSGLMEHFSPHERLAILREQHRISRSKVIAIVPNAACVAYRANKALREEEAVALWPRDPFVLITRGIGGGWAGPGFGELRRGRVCPVISSAAPSPAPGTDALDGANPTARAGKLPPGVSAGNGGREATGELIHATHPQYHRNPAGGDQDGSGHCGIGLPFFTDPFCRLRHRSARPDA